MRRPSCLRVLLAAAAALAASCAAPSSQRPPVPDDAIPAGTLLGQGRITGRVTFAGTAAPTQAINMSSDATCHGQHEAEPVREDLVVGGDGGLRYAFVHVVGGLPARPFAPPDQPVLLDQRGCVYRPHVVALQVGQALQIVNSDPTLHNVHTMSQINKPFNFGMSVKGQKAIRYFAGAEVMIRTKCDVHPWMSSYIGVVPHPWFAVTDADGRFSLSGLPAGAYDVEVWHETLGSQKQTITLADRAAGEISFVYTR